MTTASYTQNSTTLTDVTLPDEAEVAATLYMTWSCDRSQDQGPPLGAWLTMRMPASWFGSSATHRIQGRSAPRVRAADRLRLSHCPSRSADRALPTEEESNPEGP